MCSNKALFVRVVSVLATSFAGPSTIHHIKGTVSSMAEPVQGAPGASRPEMMGKWRAFRRSTYGSLLLNVLAAVVVIVLVQTLFVKVYSVPSGSMQGTLYSGDRMLVNRTAYAGGVPPRGDVVVFSADEAWLDGAPTTGSPAKEMLRYFGDVSSIGPSHEKFLVKRVIGIPGDTVDCCSAAGTLSVNGVAQKEPYIQGDLLFDGVASNCASTPKSRRCFGPVTVPEGMLLVLGDNRGNSKDSVFACRGVPANDDCVKFVPVENVIGHAFMKILPWNRIGKIS